MKLSVRLLKVTAVFSVLLLATLAAAQAQNGGPRGGGMGRGPGGNPLRLLQSEPVQKELKLTDDQKSALSKLADEQGGLSREERQQKTAETRKQIADILQPEQNERLEQIGLQLAGPRALIRPEVIEKLGISKDQKDKLYDLIPAPPGFGGFGGPPPGDAGNTPRLSREEMFTKALEILTADQRSQFEKMQGKKIDIDPSQFRGGRGQGGPGGGKNRPDA